MQHVRLLLRAVPEAWWDRAWSAERGVRPDVHIRVASPRLWKPATLRDMGSDSVRAAAAAYYRDEGGGGVSTTRDARRPLFPPELDPAGPWPTLQRAESPKPDAVPGMRGGAD